MKQKYFFYHVFLLFTALYFSACQFNPSLKKVNYTSVEMDSTITASQSIENYIKPYRDSLNAEMNEVLVIADEQMVKAKPESKLSNTIADLCKVVGDTLLEQPADFVLLNFGGLRTSLPKGAITRGKIFELMPFENELVAVTISATAFDSLISYLIAVHGQPISGFQLIVNPDKSYQLIKNGKQWKKQTSYTIITTDYLAKGGDNMTFFANPLSYKELGVKMRDAIIIYMKHLGENKQHLTATTDGRITFKK